MPRIPGASSDDESKDKNEQAVWLVADIRPTRPVPPGPGDPLPGTPRRRWTPVQVNPVAVDRSSESRTLEIRVKRAAAHQLGQRRALPLVHRAGAHSLRKATPVST